MSDLPEDPGNVPMPEPISEEQNAIFGIVTVLDGFKKVVGVSYPKASEALEIAIRELSGAQQP